MLTPDQPPSVPEASFEESSLHFVSINPAGRGTIVLIHGAFCSGSNWDLVVPYLANSYHLLIPDLPGHGQSRHITPFSLESSSKYLVQLIRKHVANSRAYIVGHSLGAHVAINLASAYPEVISDVFISGFEIYPPTTISCFAPYAFWFDQRVQKLIPRPMISWLMDVTDIQGGSQVHGHWSCAARLYRLLSRRYGLLLGLRRLLSWLLGREESFRRKIILAMQPDLWRLGDSRIPRLWLLGILR
jgi:pimeloyl-ACP methyl ester carboxylesterase